MIIDRWQIKGRLASWVTAEAVNVAEVKVQRILEVAVDNWREAGFDSYDRTENALTVRLYAHCLDVRRAPEFALFHVSWEAPQPTTDILAGVAPPATSGRPDLRFSVGDRDLIVEAKRLDGSAALFREYVVEGMKRFWDGRYVSEPGMLLAYLMGPSHADAADRINVAVARLHPPTPSDDRRVRGLAMVRSDLGKATSAYPEERVLWHFSLSL